MLGKNSKSIAPFVYSCFIWISATCLSIAQTGNHPPVRVIENLSLIPLPWHQEYSGALLLVMLIIIVCLIVLVFRLSRKHDPGRLPTSRPENSQELPLDEKSGARETLSALEFKEFVKGLPVGIYRSTPEGKVLSANRELFRIYGYKSEVDLLSINANKNYLTPKDREEFLKELDKHGSLLNSETLVRKKDGTPIWVSSYVKAHRDKSGKIIYFDGIDFDITARKNMEQKLDEILRYEKALDKCSTALLHASINDDSVINLALEALLEASSTCRAYLFENSTDPKLGLCTTLTYEVCAPGVSPQIDDPVVRNAPYAGEMRRWQDFLSKGKIIVGQVSDFPQSEQMILGSLSILSILAIPVTIDDQWYGFIGFNDTKTTRKWNEHNIRLLRSASDMIGAFLKRRKAEKELKNSTERYRGLIESQHDLVVRVDPEGRFTFVNDAYCKMFGKDRSELIGSKYMPLVHPDDLPKTLEAMKQLAKPPYRIRMEQRAKTSMGWRWLDWEDCAIHDEDGNTVEIQAVGRDITEQKNIESQLELVNKEKIVQAREIAGGFAHEIRNSLFPARGALAMLAGDKSSSFIDRKIVEKYCEISNRSLSRAIDLTKLISAYSKLDSEHFPEKVNLKQVVNDVLADNQIALRSRAIKVSAESTSEFFVRSNQRQLHSAINNLIINSIDALTNATNPHILIKWTKDNSRVTLAVEDNGVGISSKNIPRIFETFFSTKPKHGTGIGLAFTKKIIEMYKGEISVTSKPGHRTVFEIYLKEYE